jgi:hypothetical protein
MIPQPWSWDNSRLAVASQHLPPRARNSVSHEPVKQEAASRGTTHDPAGFPKQHNPAVNTNVPPKHVCHRINCNLAFGTSAYGISETILDGGVCIAGIVFGIYIPCAESLVVLHRGWTKVALPDWTRSTFQLKKFLNVDYRAQLRTRKY